MSVVFITDYTLCARRAVEQQGACPQVWSTVFIQALQVTTCVSRPLDETPKRSLERRLVKKCVVLSSGVCHHVPKTLYHTTMYHQVDVDLVEWSSRLPGQLLGSYHPARRPSS